MTALNTTTQFMFIWTSLRAIIIINGVYVSNPLCASLTVHNQTCYVLPVPNQGKDQKSLRRLPE